MVHNEHPASRHAETARQSATKAQVLFVDTAKSSPLGAGPWLHGQLARLLDRARYDVSVACAEPSSRADAPMFTLVSQFDDIEILPVDFGPEHVRTALRGPWRVRLAAVAELWRAACSVVRLGWFVRGRDISILHTDERPRDAAATVAVSRFTGSRAIIHMHVDYGDWMGAMLRFALAHADLIVAISEFVARSVIDVGVSPSRVRVVHNGINIEDWGPADEEKRSSVRSEFGLSDNTPVFITVCRLLPGKGVDDCIRMLGKLRTLHPDTALLVVGQEQERGYLGKLVALSAELGCQDHVTFAGRREDVSDLMAASDVFVMPSRKEPFGLVYLEAMATGLPVIAYDTGAAPEVIQDGVTGILVRAGNIDGLADAAQRLLTDPDLRRRFGSAGARRASESFTTAHMAESMGAVYTELLRTPRRHVHERLRTERHP